MPERQKVMTKWTPTKVDKRCKQALKNCVLAYMTYSKSQILQIAVLYYF